MKTRGFKLLVFVLFFLFLFQVVSLLYLRKPAKGGALTSVKDTLSNSRLSFVAAEDSGNAVGSSLVRLQLVGDSPPGWATTVKNFNLFPGDTIKVGDKVDYTVLDIIDDSNDDLITVSPDLETGDADADDPMIASASARHTVTLTTASAVANGAIRVRIAAAAGGADDGIPDKGGFDFGAIVAGDISCPTGTTGNVDSWESGTATASGGTGCTTGNYHCFECRYNGTLDASQALTINIGTTAPADQLINPSPSSITRTIGVADSHTFIIDHLQSDYTALDTTTGKIVVQEAVRVTATVEPTIEFTIASVGVGATPCGVSTAVTTTAATVPLGTLSITSFTAAAQQLTVSTNAASGYAVTLIEDDQLDKAGATAPFIPDSTGDGANMTHTAKADWDDASDDDAKGFGYSLHNIDCTTTCSLAFNYNDGDGNCSGTTYCGKQVPATADTDVAQTIFSSTSVANAEDVYMCYKAVISATQAAGDYENYITFVATAIF